MANDEEKTSKIDILGPAIIKQYRERLTWLRRAQEYSQKDEIPRAVECYTKYLGTLANFYEIDVEDMGPDYFDQDKDVPEMLLLSQVYWDLSKAYDRNPRLHSESEKCLEKFVSFSVGYKYQYLNSEMLRKFIKKNQAYNPKAFAKAYEKMQVRSKKCYVATHCFGPDHPTTELYRHLKPILNKFTVGKQFIYQYYRFSPPAVEFLHNHKKINFFITTIIMKPFLSLFSRILRKTLN